MEKGVAFGGIDGIYIHIPFCEHFCSYCHFVKVFREYVEIDSYLDALVVEIRSRLLVHNRSLSTLYIGGGTPSLLRENQLNRLCQAISKLRTVNESTEFTIEANPGHVRAEQLDVWKRMGINRLSIGIQSFNDAELRLLGRDHRADEGPLAVKSAAAAGFGRISIDILMGQQGQKWSHLRESLLRAVDLPIDHLSLYILEKKSMAEKNEGIIVENYEKACLLLGQSGLKQYEISNFARPGGQSRHNRAYWRNQRYYGFGASASGYDGFCEYRNTSSIRSYIRQIHASGTAVDRKEYPDRVKRQLVAGLRLRSGIPASIVTVSRQRLDRLLADKVLELKLGRLRIPSCQILRTNSILSELI